MVTNRALFGGVRYDEDHLMVEGCPIHYRRLGRDKGDPLVLIHGGSAHGGWWTEVAPRLEDRFDVIVPDLSGFGDSGRRQSYSPGLWANEIAALIAMTGSDSGTVAGHSMGGKVAIYLAAMKPSLVDSLILVDAVLRPPGPDRDVGRGRPRTPKRHYATRSDAVERFRLLPHGTTAAPDLLELIAQESVVLEDEGWTWKFDPEAGAQFTDAGVHEHLKKVPGRVGLLSGEHSSLVGGHTRDYLVNTLGKSVPWAVVPNSYHHVSLDAPVECSEALKSLIEQTRPTSR